MSNSSPVFIRGRHLFETQHLLEVSPASQYTPAYISMTHTVAAPVQQRSQVISNFRGQNILEPDHPDTLFSSKKLTTFFPVSLKVSPTPPANLVGDAFGKQRPVGRCGGKSITAGMTGCRWVGSCQF